MIAQELEISLHTALVRAHQARHESITVEHLLLVLLDNPTAAEVLCTCAVSIGNLRTHLKNFVADNTPVASGMDEMDTQSTLSLQCATQCAVMHVQSTSNNKKEVAGANVLVATFDEKDSRVVYCLQQRGVARPDVVSFVSRGIRKDQAEPAKQGEGNPEDEGGGGKENPLKQFTQNLSTLAKAGKINPLIGREQETERVVQVLCRRRKSNPLLVGEAGVGKTAITEGLAWRTTKGEVPDVPAKSAVYSLGMGVLLAGTKHRGNFEQRLKGVLESLRNNPNVTLLVGEIHTLIGVGAASDGVLDVSNLLKLTLSSGTLECIGATTFMEHHGIFEKDVALSHRFRKIDAVEPTVGQAVQTLRDLRSCSEEHHGVRCVSSALAAVAELSVRFITDRHLSGKAIDMIDEAGTTQHTLPKSKQRKTIGKGGIEVIISRIARVPSQSVSQDDRSKLQTLERDLKSVMFGQDPATSALALVIKMSRADLNKMDRPVGSLLFSDPMDVGKTGIVKQLVFILDIELIRFDMSEYMERRVVSRLIGVPLGHVGFNQGGLLTEAAIRKLHCVLLLNEIERTHLNIFNILLQVMDHGALTDNNGRKTGFCNVVIIMTTNVGAETMDKATIGLATARGQDDEMADIKYVFMPEFRNRLGTTISFCPLDEETIVCVVDKFLVQLGEQLYEKKADVIFTGKLRRFLVRKGFNPLMGARLVQRLIQDLTCKALTDELSFGKLVNDGKVVMDLNSADVVRLKFSENEASPTPAQEETEA